MSLITYSLAARGRRYPDTTLAAAWENLFVWSIIGLSLILSTVMTSSDLYLCVVVAKMRPGRLLVDLIFW